MTQKPTDLTKYSQIINDREWQHYCPVEHTVISNLRGEPCNWCDTQEPEEES